MEEEEGEGWRGSAPSRSSSPTPLAGGVWRGLRCSRSRPRRELSPGREGGEGLLFTLPPPSRGGRLLRGLNGSGHKAPVARG